MHVLIVGAGAVGQVYGFHLHRGGAKVTFFVKPKYAEAVRKGLWLYPLNGRRNPVHWVDYDVVTTVDEVRARNVDEIWLCVASPAIAGGWVEELAQAATDAYIVSLQPGIEDKQALASRIDGRRLITGLITLISWQAPLPGEKRDPPGVSYWFPPLAPNPFSGPQAAVDAIVSCLKRGGCPAKARQDVTVLSAAGEALLQPLVAALENAGWSFAALARGPYLQLAVQAARETFAVAEAFHQRKIGFARFLARASVLRMVMWVAPRLMPFDIERYLAYHFSKVGNQTRMLLGSYIRQAQTRALPHAALDELQQGLLRP